MWYNNQVARNAARYGSLTIEQQEIKVQAKASAKESRISLKEISILSRDGDILKQVKRAKQARQKISTATAVKIQFAREFDPGSG